MRTDIFGLTPRQHDMFGAPQGTFDTPMTVEEIRRELNDTLTEMRGALLMPWPQKQEVAVLTMFPDLASRLPEVEAADLVAAFNAEIDRLRRRAA